MWTVGQPPSASNASTCPSRNASWDGVANTRCTVAITLARARAHLAAGDRVVVATSCADPLARAICRELGLGSADVIASRVIPGRTGMRPLPACRGPRKVARIRAAGITDPITHAYTDSSVDLPLLAEATHRYLIDPSPAHLTRIRARLGADYVVLRSR